MLDLERLSYDVRQLDTRLQIAIASISILVIYTILTWERPYSGIPVVKIQLEGWQKLLPSKWVWILHSKRILAEGTGKFPSCFQVLTGSGYKIIVPNRFAEELKSHADLNFNEAFTKDFFPHYPGFDGMRQGLENQTFMQETVRIKLTQSLGLITDDLVDETACSFRDIFGSPINWQIIDVKENVLDLVARLSSRVFLGKPLCRDKRWLEISKHYTIDTFGGAIQLRMCPDVLRPLIYWFIPSCTRARKEVADSRRLIQPIVDSRIEQMRQASIAKHKQAKTADSIGWMIQVAKGQKVDYVAGQLALTTAAIHTTSETLTRAILWLCTYPDVAKQLREEAITTLKENGWSKVTLYKLRLMDSFLKEIQRLDALTITSMNRMVKKPINLSDGTKLPIGGRIMILDDQTRDKRVYAEAETFDAARFLRLRGTNGEGDRHQFVSTSPQHMAFGHGRHACPGRFFAANELKIALCFLLVEYDVKYPDGVTRPSNIDFEAASSVNSKVRVEIRRREAEINLIALEAPLM